MHNKATAHSKRRLPGKMFRWQRHATSWIMGICFASGMIWFGYLDLVHAPMPRLRFWWVLHGCSSLLALLMIGAAIPQHVLVTLKAKRNIWHGLGMLAGLAVLLLTALGLLYGSEDWRDTLHWVHCLLGLSVATIFPLHIWRGRRQHGINADHMNGSRQH